jgi:hypothetical protein
MSTLPEMIVGKLPDGVLRCAACGKTHLAPSKVSDPANGRRQPRTRTMMEISGCINCGHIMRLNPHRDLTRAEAAELAASPDFPRVRAVVDAAVKHLMG